MRKIMIDIADNVTAATRASSTVQSLRRFATVEKGLALLCVTIPIWLILLDGGNVRSSISAYHDMTPPQAFYFPMTVAAMMFLFNGLVRSRRMYNVVLGVLLSGIVLFNVDGGTRIVHIVFAVGFFVLNAVIILWFSQDVDRGFRVGLGIAFAAAGACWVLFDWFDLFVAEWVSLAIIAAHFVLDSIGFRGYSTSVERYG